MKKQSSYVTNLPPPVNSFIGREPELARLQALVVSPGNRLSSLTGPGGSGKTRLAVELARRVTDTFKDGIWWVDLAPVTPSGQGQEQLAQVVTHAVGLPQSGNGAPLSNLQTFLKPKNILLLLDNCEHLIFDCATLADTLLKSCPDLHILATSRERLGLDFEQILHLTPLTLPEKKVGLTTQELLNSEAARLFIQRAQAVQPDFQPDSENAETIARICFQLDGLPLALELAAAKIWGLGVSNLAARLHDRFRLLTSENRLALPRQQTLQSLLDWSYNLLPERERTVFHRLAVFNGSIPLEAVEYVCAGPYESPNGYGYLESTHILEILLELVNKSLVQAETDAAGGVVRYRLLETMREYALQKLKASGLVESNRVYQKLLDWCLKTALEVRPFLEGKEQAVWLQHLKKEHYHFNAALGWALTAISVGENNEVFSKATQLTLALALYWQRQGSFLEAGKWFLALMEQPELEKLSPETRAEVLHWAGILFNSSDTDHARQLHLQTLDLYGAQGNLVGQVKALTQLAWQAFYVVDNERANNYARQAVAFAEHLPAMSDRVAAYFIQGIIAERLGDYDKAEVCGETCLKFWREADNSGSVASALNLLAEVMTRRHEFEKARRYSLENIEVQSRFDSPISNWVCLKVVIVLLLNWSEANGVPVRWATAAGWLGAVAKAQSSLGGTPPPMTRQLFDSLLQAVRTKMDPAAFEAAYMLGRELPLAEALAQARQTLTEFPAHPVSFSNNKNVFDQLTPRELEVLRLLVKGLSNAAMAQALGVTPRTINAHLTSIYSKLGLTSRAETIRFAFENRLA
jgi:predicted ATPase/DNA-binding CsgD family transcriptional regulator